MMKLYRTVSGQWLEWLGCVTALIALSGTGFGAPVGSEWEKHIVQEGFPTSTAAAADFDGDGRMDVITTNKGKVRLFLPPSSRLTFSQFKSLLPFFFLQSLLDGGGAFLQMRLGKESVLIVHPQAVLNRTGSEQDT